MLRTPSPDMQGTLHKLQLQLGPNMDPLASWLTGTVPLASATEQDATQKWWAEQVSDVQSQRLDAFGSARDRTRRACQKGPVATGWLRTLPSKAMRTEIPDTDYRLLLRWWLGLPILPVGVPLPGCPLCRGSIDPFGDHFVCCEQNGCSRRCHPRDVRPLRHCGGEGGRMSGRQAASRHPAHPVVTWTACGCGLRLHPPSGAGRAPTGGGQCHPALQPGRGQESAVERPLM